MCEKVFESCSQSLQQLVLFPQSSGDRRYIADFGSSLKEKQDDITSIIVDTKYSSDVSPALHHHVPPCSHHAGRPCSF